MNIFTEIDKIEIIDIIYSKASNKRKQNYGTIQKIVLDLVLIVLFS